MSADDISRILTAVSVVIVSASILIVAIRGFKRLEASVGSMRIVADQVNTAVNHAGVGEGTLREVVCNMAVKLDEHIEESGVRFNRIEEHITRPSTQSRVTKATKTPKGE